VQEVDRAGAGGREADADVAGPLRVAARHEGCHLLVPHLDEVGVALRAVERADDGVDPVARVTVDPVDAPLGQALEQEVGDELGHLDLLRSVPRAWCPVWRELSRGRGSYGR